MQLTHYSSPKAAKRGPVDGADNAKMGSGSGKIDAKVCLFACLLVRSFVGLFSL
jgi:hypothetical protein